MRRDKIKRMICLGDSNTWVDEEGHRRMALAVYDKIREMEVMRYV